MKLPLAKKDHESIKNSPVPALIISNEKPTEKEVDIITACISTYEQKLELLGDVEFASRDDRYKQELSGAKRFIELHRAVLSLIRRIPVEVLQLIFIFLEGLFDIHCLPAPPWMLSLVCKHWKHVLDTTPLGQIVLPPISLSPTTRTTLFISQLSDRLESFTGPFSFSLRSSVKKSKFMDRDHPVFELLFAHATRWQHVSLELAINDLEFYDHHILNCSLPCLKTLRIAIIPGVDNYSRYMNGIKSEYAPLLHHLEVKCPYPCRIFFLFPSKQLTRYSQTSAYDIGMPQVLRDSILLTGLSYSTDRRDFSLSFMESSKLPHLKSLDLRFLQHRDTTSRYPNALLELGGLEIPSAERMRILSFHPRLLGSLIDIFSRSSPSLRRLDLFSTGLEPHSDFIRLLTMLPLLTELEISNIPSDVLESLRWHNPQFIPCLPYLQSLIVHSLPDPKRLNDMVNSRTKGDALKDVECLKSVRLVFRNRKGTRIALRELVEWNTTDSAIGQADEWRTDIGEIVKQCRKESHGVKSFLKDASDKIILPLRLQNVISSIEKCSDVDPAALLISGLPTALYKLNSHDIDILPLNERKYQFRKRAGALLDAWTPMLKYGVSKCKWIARGDYCVDFVPENDDKALRKKNRQLELAFTQELDVIHSELFWPYTECEDIYYDI